MHSKEVEECAAKLIVRMVANVAMLGVGAFLLNAPDSMTETVFGGVLCALAALGILARA